ncbi:MAG: glycosyltransferase [Microgenomates group bacterium]
MKIALVHDYLKEYGGAERVLKTLHEIWPEAPIYTIYYQQNSPAGKVFKGAKIIQSWFSYLPWTDKLISPLRFLIPLIWRSFDFSSYDLVISSASWAITKGFAKGKTKEICYCHTPPRYLYGYETSKNWQKNLLIKIYALIVNHFMRQYDFSQAQKVTWFIANSQEVQKRIKKFYRRESVVINPPVEILNFKFEISNLKYYLAGGRLEKPKNFDLIVKAFNQLGWPLKIYGRGSQEEYLRKIAKKNVEFLGWVTEEEKWRLLAGCKAFICAATDEDFGITPLEAMAVGRPVIAFRGGGYLETVIERKTGEFFDKLTVEALVDVLKKFNPQKYSPSFCRRHAKKFSKEEFIKKIKNFVKSRYAGAS